MKVSKILVIIIIIIIIINIIIIIIIIIILLLDCLYYYYYYFGVRCARPGESEDTLSVQRPCPTQPTHGRKKNIKR